MADPATEALDAWMRESRRTFAPGYEQSLPRALIEAGDALAARLREYEEALSDARVKVQRVPGIEKALSDECKNSYRLAARLREAENVLRAGVSRLSLARAAMKSYLRTRDESILEAWLLAESENGWIEEVSAALAASSGGDEE